MVYVHFSNYWFQGPPKTQGPVIFEIFLSYPSHFPYGVINLVANYQKKLSQATVSKDQ